LHRAILLLPVQNVFTAVISQFSAIYRGALQGAAFFGSFL
jgi:hypothetical protein